MIEFMMVHEFVTMIIILATLFTIITVVEMIINRNKSIVKCPLHSEEEDELDEDERE